MSEKISLEQIPLDQLTEAYYTIKERRAELSKEDKELKAKQDRIENEFNNRCLAAGLDKMGTNGVNITRYVQRTIKVSDAQAFLAWAQANDRMDLVKVSQNSDPVKEYATKHDGALPEGVGYLEQYKISVTKS